MFPRKVGDIQMCQAYPGGGFGGLTPAGVERLRYS